MSSVAVRVGIGCDIHPLAEGRALWVGGVEIPHDRGLVGYSDGDVLIHAVCDALLGALGAGDLGRLFPDTDPRWRGARSVVFLEAVGQRVRQERFRVGHLDAVVLAQAPRLAPHFPAMARAIAGALGIAESQVNLKATSPEGVGWLGRAEGMASQAVCVLLPEEDSIQQSAFSSQPLSNR